MHISPSPHRSVLAVGLASVLALLAACRTEQPGLVFTSYRDGTGAIYAIAVGRREQTMGLRGIPECEILMQDMAVDADMLVLSGDPFEFTTQIQAVIVDGVTYEESTHP